MSRLKADNDNENVPLTLEELAAKPAITPEQAKTWLEEMERERERKRAEAPGIAERLKSQLFPELLQMHLAEAVITYEGWADEGDLETITLRRTEGTVVPDDDPQWDEPCSGCEGVHKHKTMIVREALEDIAWWLLETLYPDFENNEGATGEIVLDFWGNSIRIDHAVRFIDYNHHSEEL